MKIALAQINPTVGDIVGNLALHRTAYAKAQAQGVDCVVFPELSVIGYPPKDLLLKPALLEDAQAAVESFARECTGPTAIVGTARQSREPAGRLLQNCAVVLASGRLVASRAKSLLPTYDVFDEHRYFEPGPRVELTPMSLGKRTVQTGISICEDLWAAAEHFERRMYHDNPIDELAQLGAELFINTSASPFVVGKHAKRLALVAGLARRHRLPVVFVNQVGGNDELVFDGNSCVFDAQGNLVAHAKAFEEDLLVVDVPMRDGEHPVRVVQAPVREEIEDVYHALVLGLRDYVRKCGFRDVVLGLSGGIDSAVSAAIAVAALGRDKVRGVAMPSRYSSAGSVSDARLLAERLQLAFHVVPIEPAHAAMDGITDPLFTHILGNYAADTTEENVQARLRGNIMMSLSNKLGSLLLTTGNKSELAVGYCTLYGDMCGGFCVLTDVPKTMVYDLARWINTPGCPLYQQFNGPVIPIDTITKPPSAELRPNQTDQDSLPPYDVLDEIVERYVEQHASARSIIADTGFDPAVVERIVKLIDRNEYKRKQAAPGLKITGRAFGFGRRMPIAQRYVNGNGVHPPLAATASTTG